MSLSLFGFAISWPLVGTIAALIIVREIWNLTYFKRLGIKGPMPLPLIGNLHHFKNGIHTTSTVYRKQYGNTVGAFLFSQRILFVYDLDMIKDITIKQFHKFMNHTQFVLKSRPFDKSVISLCGQQWKDVRNVITPTFSAAKMKPMSGLINECSDNLVRNFGESQRKDNQVKVFSLFESFTMEGIAKCAFGLQVDAQNDPDHPFVAHARLIIKSKKFSPTLVIAGMCKPIGKIMDYFEVSFMPAKVGKFFISVIDKAIEIRKESGDASRKDFLQILLNVEEDSEDVKADDVKKETDLHDLADVTGDESYFSQKKSTKTTLTRQEIYGQSMLFLFAGYETTNTALGFMAYSLATNPDVQDRLIQEIDDLAPDRESVNYNTISQMPYLDGVVCETLRLYPPAPVTERLCNETYTYGDVTIEKGTQVMIPACDIHRNEEYWPNPLEFDPTRFTKENREARNPFAWMPFGSGPRNCIGMRFALLEVKMAVARVLQKYRFQTTPDTVIPVKFGQLKMKPDDDIILRVVERN